MRPVPSFKHTLEHNRERETQTKHQNAGGGRKIVKLQSFLSQSAQYTINQMLN